MLGTKIWQVCSLVRIPQASANILKSGCLIIRIWRRLWISGDLTYLLQTIVYFSDARPLPVLSSAPSLCSRNCSQRTDISWTNMCEATWCCTIIPLQNNCGYYQLPLVTCYCRLSALASAFCMCNGFFCLLYFLVISCVALFALYHLALDCLSYIYCLRVL